MRLQRYLTGKIITLGQVLGSGGEGAVLEVPTEPQLVAKVYHSQKRSPDQERKLLAMLANPPQDGVIAQNHVAIAWPCDLLLDAHSCIVGFLMPRIRGMRSCLQFYNLRERRQHCPLFNYAYLHRTARNLAGAVSAIHEKGYVIGDLNESNVLVKETALITLVDTDSFQVTVGQKVYRCPVGKPEYTPPELQGKSFRDVDRTAAHDRFALAVLIFQLLMEGSHPFAGVYTGEGEPPDIQQRIELGHFPFSRQPVPYRPMPVAPLFSTLHPQLQELFIRCFETGHRLPDSRPNAPTWQAVLTEVESQLCVCPANEQHFYSQHLKSCPWCDRKVRLKGLDAFPSKQTVQQNQHLPAIKPKNQPRVLVESPEVMLMQQRAIRGSAAPYPSPTGGVIKALTPAQQAALAQQLLHRQRVAVWLADLPFPAILPPSRLKLNVATQKFLILLLWLGCVLMPRTLVALFWGLGRSWSAAEILRQYGQLSWVYHPIASFTWGIIGGPLWSIFALLRMVLISNSELESWAIWTYLLPALLGTSLSPFFWGRQFWFWVGLWLKALVQSFWQCLGNSGLQGKPLSQEKKIKLLAIVSIAGFSVGWLCLIIWPVSG